MNKLISKIVGVALGLTLATGVGAGVVLGNKSIAKADAIESAAYTLDGTITGGDNGYATESTITQNSVEWGVTGNTTMNPWRIGGKNLTNIDRLVKSNASVSSEDITKVVLTVGTTNLTVNSLSLLVGTSAGGSQTSTVTGTFAASSSITFSRPSGADWSSKYFTFDFNVSAGSSNKYVEFKSAVFYYEAGSSVTYTVTYDGNGSTGGSVPVDSNSPYNSGATVTVLGNTGNLVRTNYTFNGWNTAAGGTGTDYTAGDTFSIGGNTTLYAQWLYAIHYTEDTTAQTITWNLSMPEYVSASASEVEWNSPKATLVASKGEATTDANNYLPPANNSSRFYKNSSLAITPATGYRITSVVATAATEGYATKLVESTWTNASATASTTTVTITPVDKTAVFSAVLGDTVGLTEVVVNYTTDSAATLTSIAVTGSMSKTSYYVGDDWDASGLVVTATYSDSSTSNVTSGVTWTFSPAKASATSVTSVVATASYTEGGVSKTADSTAQVVTVAEKQGSTDVITVADTSATGTSYVTTTGIAGDTAIYTSHNAHANEANGNGLQYRSNDNTSGIVSTTSGGLIKSVTITYADGKSGQIDVYGKNAAYSSPADLYSDSAKGTLLGSVSSTGTVTVSGDYEYVGVRSNNGARYLTSIEFVWGAVDSTAPKITIDQTSSEQVAGDSGTLTATTENAGSNAVIWSSSDSSVVSINESSGAWQAKKIGIATITATLGTTGKFSTITISVTGNVSVAEARDLIDELGSGTSEYKVTVSGYVTAFNGDGTKNNNNSITIADTASGTDTFQIFFGYKAVENWATAAVIGAKVSAKGNLTKYNTTYEMTSPTNLTVIDSDKAAVQDFVRDYMHMNDYDPSLDNSQGTGACNGASGYYMTAKGALTGLTETQVSLFQSDSEFDAAQARYEAWARAYGDSTPYATTVGSARMINLFNNSSALIIVVITAFVSVTFVGGYFFLRKKKEN